MMKLSNIIERTHKEKGTWLDLESNYRKNPADFSCVIYISEEYWRATMREIHNSRGLVSAEAHEYYTSGTLFGFDCFTVMSKDTNHPDFRIVTTS